ncbi:ABC transporter permease [Ruminococcus sp. AM42-11]|uniref:ABC transporter permease n=1 Tax=Ruminococcus sp. AM42-11 TaxID=2292372 RepID=UPI000E5343E1|nr:FtsX-like permease family protein [Ruminococcus sp. AM42-11]RHS96222.1 ABC transporter permease [Ruminococcus sp. AM42-11]
MKALRKEFWMEIRKSKSRFISILLIVALGVAFFSGIQASSPDMRYSGDAYYDESSLMDIKVVGTMGLTSDDVSSIESIDGIESAEGAWSTDVMCGEGQKQKVLHIESINDTVNKLDVQEGRLPEKSGEIFLDSTFASSNEYKVGDKVALREEGDSPVLVTTEYTVVGTGRSPLYISFNRGNTTLGTGEVNGFGYVLPEDFDQEIYTQIYVTVHGAKGLTSYTDGYENLIAKIKDRVENIADDRCQIRLAAVKADAQEEINDAQKKLDDGKKEADEKLADAKEELDKGEKDLEDGRKEYEDGKSQLEDAKTELADGKKQLEDAKTELTDGKNQLEDAKAQLADGKSQLESARSQLSSSKSQLDTARSQLDDGWSQVNAAKAQLADGQAQLDSAQKQVTSGLAELEENQKTLDENKAKLADGKAQIEEGEQQLEAAKQTLTTKQSELDQSKAEIIAGQQQIESTRTQLNAQKQQITDGLSQVSAGEAQLQDGISALESAKAQLTELQSQIEIVRASYNAALENPDASQEEIDILAAQVSALEEQEAAVSQQIQASEAQIESQRQQLAATRSELESGLAAVEDGLSQLSQKESELNAGREQITAGQAEIDAGWIQIQEQENTLAASKAEIEAGEQELEKGQKQLKAAKKKLNKAQKEIDSNAETLAAGQAELDANVAKLNDSEAQYASGLEQYNSGARQIAENEAKLTSGEQEIAENEAKLADGEKEIADNEKKLADGEKEITDNEKKLQDAVKDLKKGEKDLADGKKEYEDAKKDAEDEIAENQQKLDDAKKELEDLEMPEWMVTDREELPEYTDYGDNADRLRNIGQVFPVIFFLVAALISLTTMTRMVEEQRTQIGTLKALGYKKSAIAAKYICYAFFATLLGSVLGMLIGEKIIPYIIITAYGIMYHNVANTISIDYQPGFALIASTASVVCTVGATLFASGKELQETPASLMRPPAPKEGKRVLLERLTFIWKHLSFSWKSTIRNLFRYKKRLIMTVFGIAGSMGLMLVGFGIQDSISDIAAIQYRELQHYDGMVIEDSDATEEEHAELFEYMKENEQIAHCNRVQMTKISAPKGSSNISIYLFVPESLSEFARDVTLKNRITGETYELTDEGAAISEKTASLLGLKVGDMIPLKKGDKEYKVRVAVITENYMSHYLYMTPRVYEQTFGEMPEYENIVFTMQEDCKDDLEMAGTRILANPGALSISYTSSLASQVDRMLSTLDAVILVLIVSAGMLAFVVLYNLNNINITERQRELATLKVLGFYDGEVSQYVLRENVILTVLGIMFGAVFGILIHRYVITTVEVDAVMFGRNIKPLSFLYSGILTSIFSIVVNGVMHFKLKTIDMVESLKSVE